VQHSGIALLLDRWEKHLLFGTHKSNEFVFFVQQKKDPQSGMCLYTGILTAFRKSGRVLMFCQCSGLQWWKQAVASIIHPGQNNGRLVIQLIGCIVLFLSEDRAKIIRYRFWCFFIFKTVPLFPPICESYTVVRPHEQLNVCSNAMW